MKFVILRILGCLYAMILTMIIGFAACQPLTPSQRSAVVGGGEVIQSLPPILQSASTLPGTSTKTASGLGSAASTVEKLNPVIGATSAAATQPGATPVTVIVSGVESAAASGLIPQPIAGYITLGAFLLSVIGNIIQKQKVASATAATASVTNAVQAGVASGQISILPGATQVVDAAVNGHPSTDAMVDLVAVSGGGKL